MKKEILRNWERTPDQMMSEWCIQESHAGSLCFSGPPSAAGQCHQAGRQVSLNMQLASMWESKEEKGTLEC